mmetsp:Transcript_60838/g.111332  ORF Transcript_60838/g.111332 Transcript_60838/m.111332 type:complete len:685 (+) Transcript_60838:109-2163(+)
MLGTGLSPAARKATGRRSSDRNERLGAGRHSLSRSTGSTSGEVHSPGVPAQLPRRKPASSSSAPLLPAQDDRAGVQPVRGDEAAANVGPIGSLDVSFDLASSVKDRLLAVFACGQTVQLDIQGGLFFADIHSQLQSVLNLEGRVFQFFSAHGEPISTDEEIRDIVNRGETPLTACLAEVPATPIVETRHEDLEKELVQMQWKLMQEQFSVTTERVAEMQTQVQDLQQELNLQRNEHEALTERLRTEIQCMADTVRENCKCDLMQLAERVNAVSQLLAKERNVHKVATQGVEKQIQNVRETFEGEHSWLRQEILRATNSMLQDSRCLLEAEAHARQALEDRYTFDMKKLSERVEEVSWTQAKDAQERGQAYKKAALEADQALQAARQLSNTRTEIEAYVENSAARQQELEDRCISLEAKMLDRQLAVFDQLGDNWCNTGAEKVAAEKKSVVQEDVRKSPVLTDREEGNDDLVRRVMALERVAKNLEMGEASAMCKYCSRNEGRWESGLDDRHTQVDGDRGPFADVETKLRQNMEPVDEAPRSVLGSSRTSMQFISPLPSNRVISVVQPVSVMRPSNTSTPGCSYVTMTPSNVTMTPSSSPQQVQRDIAVEAPIYYTQWRSPSVDKFEKLSSVTMNPGAATGTSITGSIAAPTAGSPPPIASGNIAATSYTTTSYMAPPMNFGARQ